MLIDFSLKMFYTHTMNYAAAFIIIGLCFTAMAVGLIVTKRILKKGCSLDPDSCLCRREGKDPDECEKKN